MKYFEEPKFEIVNFEAQDVITTSGDNWDMGEY